MQDLVPAGGIAEFWTTAVTSYATDHRPADAEGAGPGMFWATALVRELAQAGLPCFSGLAIPGGVDWQVFMLRLNLRDVRSLPGDFCSPAWRRTRTSGPVEERQREWARVHGVSCTLCLKEIKQHGTDNTTKFHSTAQRPEPKRARPRRQQQQVCKAAGSA